MIAPRSRVPRDLPAMPLALGDVTVELVGYAAEPSAGEWTRADHGPWMRELGDVRVSVEPQAAPDPRGLAWMELHVAVTALRPVRVRHVAVELRARCAAPPVAIDRELRWRPLADAMLLYSGAPLVLRWRADGATMELRSPCAAPCRTLRWRAGVLLLELVLDSAALHPRWSFAANPHVSTSVPVWPAGRSVCTRLLLRRVDAGEGEVEPVVTARFPAGREAALVITDHSDYDTAQRLLAFLDGRVGTRRGKGWLGRGLRLTKGVFALPSTPPPPRVPAASLEDPVYLALVRRLHDEGSEIAPHGVNESGNIAVGQFREGLARVVRMFAPRTWIDHGMTLRYAYTMGGAAGEYELLRVLRAHGITTLWAYQDVPVNAAGTLNMLAPAAGDAALLARHASRHFGRGAPLVAAHYLRSLARGRMDGSLGQLVSTALSLLRHGYMTHLHASPAARGTLLAVLAALASLRHARAWAREVGSRPPEAPYSRGEALAMCAVVYPERAAPLSDVTGDDLLLFTTMEVLHTSDVYTPAAIERLVAERGVHIGHCYLLNRLPYLAGVFDTASDRDRLSPGWLAALALMEAEVGAGRLWNPPVGELAEWMRAVQLVEMVPVAAHAVELRSSTDESLAGFTMLLPPRVSPTDVRWGAGAPAGARRWGDWLAVWGDVPARATVRVRWGDAA